MAVLAQEGMEVQSLMLKLLNTHCADVDALREGPRQETRVNLSIVMLVVPCEGGRPQVDRAFSAVTKEVSTTGVSLILNEPMGLDEVFLGFRLESEMKFLRARAKHLNPMGAGIYQVGLSLTGVVHATDHADLDLVSI